jgi:hypothetical protein
MSSFSSGSPGNAGAGMASDGPLITPSSRADQMAELADLASRGQRRNQPKWLIVLGVIALLGAGVYAGVGYSRRVSAQGQIDAAAADLASLSTAAARYTEAKDLQSKLGGPDRLRIDPLMLDKLRESARTAGLEPKADAERDDARPSPRGFKRRQYEINFEAASAETLFTWLKDVPSRLPGMQLFQIFMQPGNATADEKPGWNVRIVFTRWEQQETKP